jgi:RimJ/RimL family protein N-acetyltransferase
MPSGRFAALVDGRVIGGAVLMARDEPDTVEFGDFLAPAFRALGFGREIAAGVAAYAHEHLGIARIVAGLEPTNYASVRQFDAAGWWRCDGPDTHRLPDGREVDAQWWMHEASPHPRCAWWRPS